MSTIQFANNAVTALAGAISNTATTANLTTGSGALFPALSGGQYFKATLVDAATGTLREIVKVTAISGDTVTLVRAQEGTTALAWQAGDTFSNLLTKGVMDALLQIADLGSNVVQSFNTRQGAVTLTLGDVTTALGYTPISPTNLATTGAYGIIQLANTTEAKAGVEATKAMTAADVAAAIQGGGFLFATDGSSSGNSPNISTVPAINAPPTGVAITYRQNHDNSAAVTLTIGSSSASAVKYQGADLASGQLKAGHFYTIMWDATNSWWQLISPPG